MPPSKLVRWIFVGAVVGMAVGAVVGGGSIRLSPLATRTTYWLFFTAFLAFVVWLVLMSAYRRRHLSEIRLRDASAEPAPMRPFEQAWDAELKHLGFRYVGVLELTGPLDRPEKYWEYAHEDGRVCADICQRRRYASFFTRFQDGAMLTTRNTTNVPTVDVPFWRAVNVPGPGGSLTLACQAHLASLRPFAAAHGEAVQGSRQTMADVLADEERLRAITPELLRLTRGWPDRLGEVAILLLALFGWLYQGWLLLKLL